MLISIGIFAHNEERDIGTLISDLAKQDLLINKALSIDIHVVANGCTDNTGVVSKAALATEPFYRDNIATLVHDLSRPGKSNAWNELFTGLRHRTRILFFASTRTSEFPSDYPSTSV